MLTSGVLVFTVSLQLSSYSLAIEATTSMLSSHVQIQDTSYLKRPKLRTTIKNPEKIRSSLHKIPEVDKAAFRSAAFSLISSESRTYGVQILGVEPDIEEKISTIPKLIRTGVSLSSKAGMQVILGKSLANNLKVKVGDEVSILGQAKDGSIAAGLLKIKGIYESASRDVDRNLVQIHIDDFNEIFYLKDEVNYIAIQLQSIDLIENAPQFLSQSLKPNTKLRLWHEIIEGLKEAIELDAASGWLFYLSLIIVVTLSIINTLTMAVLERTKEFGVLLALGTRPKSIAVLILLEGFLLGIIGVFSGLVFGSLVVQYFNANGFMVPGSEEVMKVWYMPGVVYPSLSFESLSKGPRVVFLATVVASIYPAIKASKIKPLKALRS